MINTQLESWITRIFSPCAVWTSPLCICGQRFQWFLRLMLHKDENMARKYKKRFISLIIHRTVLCNIKVNPSSRCFLIHILNDEDVSGFVCSTRWWNAVMASSSCPEIPDRRHHRGNYSRWEFRPRAASRGGGLLEFSTVWDGDLLGSPPRPGTQSLHFLDNIHSVLHAAKDNVPTIQPKWTEEINIPPK